ncbi:MAG TPA: amylo-alpha-1,6-glucosidase [Parafilimonas sp.]|nr:amylo-alpha-1,6-glucosidase [Parafilimonas sp.]
MLSKNRSDINKEAGRINISSEKVWQAPSEWLETNGLGGWASSSITGCNTRRYHGLLIAATKPPVERMALVSKLDETIIINEERFELGTNNYGDIIHPSGYRYLTSFTKELFPEWTYEVNGIVLRKTIAMVHGENTTLVQYEIVRCSSAFILELLPLIAARGYHSLQHSNKKIFRDAGFENGVFKTLPYDGAPDIFIAVPGATYTHRPQWFNHFNYAVEKYRGLDYVEDLFNHGAFSIELNEGDKLGIIISTQTPANRNAFELFEREKARKLQLIQIENSTIQPINLSTVQQLTLTADQFIVKRIVSNSSPEGGGWEGATVIAGYHWFTDWGRDTMIALPGLCLSTGRYEDAKKIIAAFAQSMSMGMLPNRFQDNNEPPEYNNVDGTLWYFIAVYKYLQHTNDTRFILDEILPVLKNIIDWHFKGTRYNIHVDEDGLLYAGEKGQQLTWMDARIGDWVVTPRMGKPVEIQALWYNTLKIFTALLELNDQPNDAGLMNVSAEKANNSFNEKFWYAEGNYLYDVIDENGNPDATLRPNQLFAASLPFPLINEERTAAVLKIVKEKLYTPVGLRSLTPDDKQYVGIYGGDVVKRDSAYHQGTVWSWLLGSYIDVMMKVDKKYGKEKATNIIHHFSNHLNEGCIGSVSEIMDAEGDHYPRGCIAQAWGVSEILRVIKEYNL